MKALVIVLLVLTVLMLIPLGIDGGYNGKSLILRVRIGLLNIRVFPLIKKLPEIKLEKPKVVKEVKEKKPVDLKQVQRLVKTALKALGRFRRKLRVDYIRIHYTFASNDPFSTAMGFGASTAVMSTIVPLVENAFIIDERDIGTSFDFLSEKPVFDCWITISIQVWEILYIAIAFGIDYLRLKIRHKREYQKRKE